MDKRRVDELDKGGTQGNFIPIALPKLFHNLKDSSIIMLKRGLFEDFPLCFKKFAFHFSND
jgi:hypothetical protein